MDGAYFLIVAKELCNGRSEGHWRSAVSRAYYSAFHAVVAELAKHDIIVPANANGHERARQYLNNSGDSSLAEIGTDLGTLRSHRNDADYEMQRKVDKFKAQLGCSLADQILKNIKQFALRRGDAKAVIEAIREYKKKTNQ